MKSSKSYMKSVKSHGMHSAHDGGQAAKSFGKGTSSPHTDKAAAAPVKGSGGHKSGSKY